MPKYKVRVPQPGTVLYGDGDTAVVADTIDDARETFQMEYDEEARYLHSLIGRCSVVYKLDVDAGDCHEDAEPGDTTISYVNDDGRELNLASECRVWMLGPPSVSWSMKPTSPRAIDLPVGTKVHHKRLGDGVTTAQARMDWGPARAFLDVAFESGRETAVSATSLFLSAVYGGPKPVKRYELEVAGEDLGEGPEEEMRELRDQRIAVINDAWKAEQDRLAGREAVPA